MKTRTFLARHIDGPRYQWAFWRDPIAGLWFLRDYGGHVVALERTWIDSVMRIRAILANHGMTADID